MPVNGDFVADAMGRGVDEAMIGVWCGASTRP